MSFDLGPWPTNGTGEGPNPLTPAQARRLRASTRFSVGDGIRLRGIDPAHPRPGDAVVIIDPHRTVVGAAVLTDTGPQARDHGFALWAPPSDTSTGAESWAQLRERRWILVEAGLTWHDILRLVGEATAIDPAAVEAACVIADPTTGRRISMTRFDAPPPTLPRSAPSTAASRSTPSTTTETATSDPNQNPTAERQPRGIDDLATALDVLASVKEAYAAYECDYQRVLAAPALADVTEDATATFVEAFQQAVALEPEDPRHCPPGHAARFIAAVSAAEAAWEAAEANATRLGIAGFDPAERTQIRRARQALDLALRADTPAGEREVSLATARRLLAGLVTFPAPLEVAITRALSTGTGPRPALES